MEDHRAVDISAADRAMLDYAVKLTLEPGRIVSSDVEALRDHGFEDRAIHDICAITSYYAFVNRIADGLGVELEGSSAEEGRSEDDVKKRKQSYRSDELTVTFDPNVCIHSAVCLRSLPGVFDISKKRWIRLENGSTERVIEVVSSCPSGALAHEAAARSDN